VRYRVEYRLGGRESASRYAGSFGTMREAKIRRDWVSGELAALRVPDLSLLAAPAAVPTLRDVAERWKASDVDVSEGTRVLHRVALDRVLPLLGDRPVDAITGGDVAELVTQLTASGRKRETIRKSVSTSPPCSTSPASTRTRHETGSASGCRSRSSRRSTRRPPHTWKPCTGCSRPPTGCRCSGSTGQAHASRRSTRCASATTTSATAAFV
jgi:hypothetical protein